MIPPYYCSNGAVTTTVTHYCTCNCVSNYPSNVAVWKKIKISTAKDMKAAKKDLQAIHPGDWERRKAAPGNGTTVLNYILTPRGHRLINMDAQRRAMTARSSLKRARTRWRARNRTTLTIV